MKSLSLLALSLALPLLVACTVGEYGDTGSDTTGKGDGTSPDANVGQDDGKAAFQINVKPTVQDALCGGCHGLTQPTFDTFEALGPKYKAKATAGILLTKGPHQGSPYFTDAQKANIQIYVDSLK